MARGRAAPGLGPLPRGRGRAPRRASKASGTAWTRAIRCTRIASAAAAGRAVLDLAPGARSHGRRSRLRRRRRGGRRVHDGRNGTRTTPTSPRWSSCRSSSTGTPSAARCSPCRRNGRRRRTACRRSTRTEGWSAGEPAMGAGVRRKARAALLRALLSLARRLPRPDPGRAEARSRRGVDLEAAPPRPTARQDLHWQPALRYRHHWPRMPAFAVPSFYDGRIRINLKGRERDGVVEPSRYEETCRELETLLLECRNPRTGEPVVESFERASTRDPLALDGLRGGPARHLARRRRRARASAARSRRAGAAAPNRRPHGAAWNGLRRGARRLAREIAACARPSMSSRRSWSCSASGRRPP